MINIPAMLSDFERELRAQGRPELEINDAMRQWLSAAEAIIQAAKAGAGTAGLSEPHQKGA